MNGGFILVTGGTGQVGLELARQSDRIVAPPRTVLDLADPDDIATIIASRPWAAVINSAAYTGVDSAESEGEAAWRINAFAPALLARETARLGIPLLQVSTDYVFDGQKSVPYVPHDAPAPLGVYGASKLAGEIAVRTVHPRHAIVRTAWVISAHRSNFVKTMLRVGQTAKCVRVVDDQFGSPTSAADLARALLVMADKMIADPTICGTWHFVNQGQASWYDLARAVFGGSAIRGGPSPEVVPIGTAEYPTPARRPVNSRLDCSSLRHDFGIEPGHWEAALDQVLDDLFADLNAVKRV